MPAVPEHADDLRSLMVGLAVRVEALDNRVQTLEAFRRQRDAGRGPRDWQDADVLAAIAQTIGARPFTSRECSTTRR
jgi:hypothetical protein